MAAEFFFIEWVMPRQTEIETVEIHIRRLKISHLYEMNVVLRSSLRVMEERFCSTLQWRLLVVEQ